jgi:hypothetical protein
MPPPTSNMLSLQARLYAELCDFRTYALADPRDRLHRFELLLNVARLSARGSTDKERVKDVLEQAIGRMGSVYGPVLQTLFGLTDASWGRVATERHELAYRVFCKAEQALAPTGHEPIVFVSFRTHTEREMLKDLASQLLQIATRSEAARRQRNPSIAK